jgi:hypothetical protein
MPTVLERIRKLNHIVRWLEKEILATGGAQGYDSVCTQVKQDATRLQEVTLTHLEGMSPPARVAHPRTACSAIARNSGPCTRW